MPEYPLQRDEKRQALLDAVESVRDVITASADEAEANGTLSPQVADALDGVGLFGLKLPIELGGAEADPVTQFDVIEAIAYLDPSTAWCTMVGATSIGLLGAFLPDEAIGRIFDGGVPTAAAALMPVGKVTPVDGGYTLSGRWMLASGIRHSRWVAGGALVDRGDAGREHRMFVVPVESVEIHDNWHVAGLRGTGSCDFSLPESFIADAFSWDLLGGTPQRGGHLYRLRHPGFSTNEHAAFAIGVGRRCLDLMVEGAVKRRGFKAGASQLAERSTFQRSVGESELRLRAARALAIEIFEGVWETASTGRPIEPRQLAEIRGVAAYTTQVALDVVALAFREGGASALYNQSMLQRLLRDMYAAGQHLIVSETAYDNLGQFVLGLPGADPRG